MNGGTEEEDEEGSRGDSIFLPPIKEQENSDTSPIGLAVPRSKQRPVSLSPRVKHHDSSDSSDGDEYQEGVIGTTPPYAQRLSKTRRRSNKFKRMPSPYQDYRDKQRTFTKSRPLSADWISSEPRILAPEISQPRRHTISDVVLSSKKTYGFNNYASFEEGKTKKTEKEGGGGKRKKKEKERKQDRDEKSFQHHQQSVSSLDNIPQLKILSPVATPPSSFADKVTVRSTPVPKQHPLLVTSLTSHELHASRKLLDEEGTPRIVRSNSDIQISLTLSSSQSIRCPSDRNKFYKNFRKALNVLSKRQNAQQATGMHQSGFHVPRQHSENLGMENPYAHMVDQIWREFRAWQAERTLEEQEDWDFEHHREVEVVLNRVIQYRFDSQSEVLNSRLFTGTETRARDDYEPLTSLTSATRFEVDGGNNNSEETTPLSSLNAGVATQNRDDCDGDEDGPRTLTQQGSTDSDESSASSKSSGEYSIEKFLSPEQLSALSEVNQLLEELENVEGLYSNSRKIGDENPKYRQPSFRRKRDAIILWVKVTKGLADHLSRLSKWFGVQIIPPVPSVVHTPCTPSRSTSDSTSHASHPLSNISTSDLSYIDPEASLGGLSRLSSIGFLSQSSQFSSGSSNKGRNFSPRIVSNIDSSPSLWKGYRKFVDRTLKKKGLKWMIDELLKFISPIFCIAEEAIKVRVEDLEEGFTEEDDIDLDPPRESWPLLPYANFTNCPSAPLVTRVTSTTPRCWLDQFYEMNLPSFAPLVSDMYSQ